MHDSSRAALLGGRASPSSRRAARRPDRFPQPGRSPADPHRRRAAGRSLRVRALAAVCAGGRGRDPTPSDDPGARVRRAHREGSWVSRCLWLRWTNRRHHLGTGRGPALRAAEPGTRRAAAPALALRADLSLPVGGFAGEDPVLGLKAIATRSWGAIRAHANASVTPTSDEPGPAAEPEWSASLAVDRTFFRSGLLLLAELSVLEEPGADATEATVAAGARYQLTPTLVLDARPAPAPRLGRPRPRRHRRPQPRLRPGVAAPARTALPAGRDASAGRGVLPARRVQLAVPRPLPRGGAALQRLRLRARRPVRAAADPGRQRRMPRSRGSTATSPAISWSGRPGSAWPRRSVMPRVRPRDLAGEADVRLGPRAPPPDLRCLCRRRGSTGAERDSLIERLTD